ncbi:DUF2474 domain-containing protein [Polymorphobacter megasporae]|nr:DUF2474 domain-containing protein [Polymorphobacter megasporae]UAJ09568.1 DUF2474 domain-containing protein [Polymorphobacter megasporae]
MSAPESSTAKRLAWFVGLWVAGVATVAAVGLVIRLWLHS